MRDDKLTLMKHLLFGFFLCASSVASAAEQLVSGEYFVEQSWSQETEFERPYFVNVPASAEPGKRLPVFLFLHGNGGSAEKAIEGFMRRNPTIAGEYILVFPQGYEKSWNIVSERSQADDRGFIESIILDLSEYDNVQEDDFTVMGSSNGAALVNQMAIETQLAGIRNYVTSVSQLNTYQHDGKNFKAKGADNNYEVSAEPMKGKRLLNISGENDALVPYHGGPSRGIPAKSGKLAFVDAEESIFLWAGRMGYQGERLTGPSRVEGKFEIFSYLDGDVIHYRVLGEGHGATGAVGEEYLLEFLKDS